VKVIKVVRALVRQVVRQEIASCPSYIHQSRTTFVDKDGHGMRFPSHDFFDNLNIACSFEFAHMCWYIAKSWFCLTLQKEKKRFGFGGQILGSSSSLGSPSLAPIFMMHREATKFPRAPHSFNGFFLTRP